MSAASGMTWRGRPISALAISDLEEALRQCSETLSEMEGQVVRAQQILPKYEPAQSPFDHFRRGCAELKSELKRRRAVDA